MENPRPEKVAIVDEVRDRIGSAEAVVVTEYRGMSVADFAELRTALRPAGGSYKVYKNTLVRRAATEIDDEFTDLLVGPTALAFAEDAPDGQSGDVAAVAKALRDFAKTNPSLIVKGGVFDGSFIDADGLKKLADIEPREVLLAKLAGAMAAPMTNMAGLLAALPRNFANGLKALIDQGGAPGAPADEAPAAEAPADEAAAEAPADEAPAAEASADQPEEEAAEAADSEEDSVADAAEETSKESE